MSLLLLAKRKLDSLPYPAGWLAAQLPFGVRPGIASIYKERSREIGALATYSPSQKQDFVFSRVQRIASWAYQHIPFYTELYRAAGVDPGRFRHFEELASLPIVTKEALQAVPLEMRSAPPAARSLENTGGSSGQPLSFYVEPTSIPHEWAHMHQIWRRVGYRSRDLKIALSGRSSIRNVLQYDAIRHHVSADVYTGWSIVADRLLNLPPYVRPKFLHGYPSAIFDFVQWLEDNQHPLLQQLQDRISGLLLGSEYPAPAARAAAERSLRCASVSWYGHTERSVLAYEKEEKSVYHPFLSYGFAESVPGPDGDRLIGTSYYNTASPFIRYDTGDLVDAEISTGILQSFRVARGRVGDFILDARGHKVFLTAVIFGRHHAIFDHCRYIQVSQGAPGSAVIYVVPKNSDPINWPSLFDASNVEIRFAFQTIDEPLRTPAGKVPLLIRNSDNHP